MEVRTTERESYMVKKKFNKLIELLNNQSDFEFIEFRFSIRAACPNCRSDGYFRRVVVGDLQNHGCLKFERSHDVSTWTSGACIRKKEKWLAFLTASGELRTFYQSTKRLEVIVNKVWSWWYIFWSA